MTDKNKNPIFYLCLELFPTHAIQDFLVHTAWAHHFTGLTYSYNSNKNVSPQWLSLITKTRIWGLDAFTRHELDSVGRMVAARALLPPEPPRLQLCRCLHIPASSSCVPRRAASVWACDRRVDPARAREQRGWGRWRDGRRGVGEQLGGVAGGELGGVTPWNFQFQDVRE
jgi:hypothetical protein